MNIALIAHDAKKELMVQFCIAYCPVLAQHNLTATGTTGKLVSEATGLPIQRCLSGTHGPCGGILEPIGVWVRKNGEWAILHRCTVCGKISSNRIAADDNPMKLMSLAMKPVSSPPFPLERIEEMTRLMGGDGELKW